MVKIRVCRQPVSESLTWQLSVGLAVQPSVATTKACTLSQVGRFVGLQPSFPPGGQVVIEGWVVSTVQGLVTRQGSGTLPRASWAVMVKMRVCRQPVSESLASQLRVGDPSQSSLANTNAFMLSQVGSGVGLQPKLPPGGQVVIVGLVVSI